MLKLIDITKEYKVEEESVLALHGVSIEFRKNEFVSILGPSGCGKTTLLNIIGGLDRYTSGDIQVDNISTKEYDDIDWDTYRNRRIGFVFQSYNLIPHMNILKNVAMGLTLAGVEREERRQRALEALRKVGLESQARKKPNQLSGGQMQRVAIARALVNNPEIILADEPTGALDSESGIQVMDLLKEVAQDRLVIMVTHNPLLAEEYSTRIVYLKDGEVEGDTMPYSSEEPDGEEAQDVATVKVDKATSVGEDIKVADSDAQPQQEPVADEIGIDKKKVKKKSRFCLKMRKRREKDNSSMKLGTAISLSWNNLLSKKGRTLLTSIAGSIGIIGIILVLSLSNGASAYVRGLEENALSTYPLTISQTNMDMNSIMSLLMKDDGGREDHPDSSNIFVQSVLGNVLENFSALMEKNDLHALKKYIDENFDDSLATVKYNYGTDFNAYKLDPKHDDRYMKVNPYTEVMDSVLETLPDWIKNMNVGNISVVEAIGGFASNMQPWAEMSSNQKLLDSQYELVGAQSRWPSKANEIVVVVDSKNQLADYELFMLGLKSPDDVLDAITSESGFATDYELSDLLGLEYKILTNADYLEDNGDGTWTGHSTKENDREWIDEHATITCKVVGVVRPKPGVSVTSINGAIGYTSALNELMINTAKSHPAIKKVMQLIEEAKAVGNDYYDNIINYTSKDGNSTFAVGDMIMFEASADAGDPNNTEHNSFMRMLGVVDMDYPISIDFYCSSFEAKEKIVQFINEYNEKENKNVRYGDSLSTIMEFVNTMTSTITGVLVAFAAISLVVSTIMIAIIIYTSVLERRKEIGVLRSIGARKKDISRVFIAESAILGAYSGIIGLIVSAIVALVGSKVLAIFFEIENLMQITWWHCLMMFVISVVLSMLAGFIPSRIAANKDPAIALRSE